MPSMPASPRVASSSTTSLPCALQRASAHEAPNSRSSGWATMARQESQSSGTASSVGRSMGPDATDPPDRRLGTAEIGSSGHHRDSARGGAQHPPELGAGHGTGVGAALAGGAAPLAALGQLHPIGTTTRRERVDN